MAGGQSKEGRRAAVFAVRGRGSGSIRLCRPHSLQHVLDRAFCKRELLCIAGAQHHIRVGPVLRIEKRIAADRDLGIGFGNFTELHANVALAHVRADPLREHGNATSSSIACMIEGTPAITITLPIQKPGAPDTLLRMRSAPLGMRVRRRRASFISAPVVFTHSCKMRARADRCRSAQPNAFATQSAVMSPWVGPIPPVVMT